MKTSLPGRLLPVGLSALMFLLGTLAFAQTAAKPVLVTLETDLGAFTVEVDVAHAPVTGSNFLKYVDGKFYDGGIIDRTVRADNTRRHDVEIQVIQLEENPARKSDSFPAISLERTSVTGLKHLNGTISMARGGADTATASFFVCIGDQPELNFGGKRNADGQGFAAFGSVVEGMDIVGKIHAARTVAKGEFGTETIDPPIHILKAYRKTSP